MMKKRKGQGIQILGAKNIKSKSFDPSHLQLNACTYLQICVESSVLHVLCHYHGVFD